MLNHLKVFHQGLILVALPLFIEILLISGLTFLLHQAEEAKVKEMHSRRMTAIGARLLALAGELPTLQFLNIYAGEQWHSDKITSLFEKGKQRLAETIKQAENLEAISPEAKAKDEIRQFPAKMLELFSRVELMTKPEEDASIVWKNRKSGTAPLSPTEIAAIFDQAVADGNFGLLDTEMTRAAREAFEVAGATGVRRLINRVNQCKQSWSSKLSYQLQGNDLVLRRNRGLAFREAEAAIKMTSQERQACGILEDTMAWYRDIVPPLAISLGNRPPGKTATVSANRIVDETELSDALTAVVATGLDNLLALMKEVDAHTEEKMQHQKQLREWENIMLFAGAGSNIIVGIFLAVFYRRRFLDRICTISKNTRALSANEAMSKPLSGEDEIAQLDHAFHNMKQQLLEASEREHALFQNASDVICVLNDRHEFIRGNPACIQHWGYEPAELQGKTLDVLAVSAQDNSLLSKLAEARMTAEPISFECNVKTKTGQERNMLWSAYWSETETSLFCVVHDQTELKNLEKSKLAFMNLMSSDLMVPLTTIAGKLQKLGDPKESRLSADAQIRLDRARQNLARLVALVDDLLQVNRLESTVTIKLRKKDCHASDIFSRLKDEVEVLASKKGIAISMQITDELWHVDSDRIMQVLVNLVSNAVKFSEPSSTITITAQKAGEFMLCKVQDQGRGIHESKMQAVFEKFKQAEASDGRRLMGTGLGLPICKQIVEAHGGEIGVDSVEGKGSTFWFKLPADEAAPSLLDAARKEPAASTRVKLGAVPSNSVQPPLLVVPKSWSHQIGLSYKGAILVVVPVVCEIALVCMLFSVLAQVDQERSKELFNVRVGKDACALMVDLLDAEMRCMHRFKYFITGKSKVIEDLNDAYKVQANLKNLIQDDKEQLQPVLNAERKIALLTDYQAEKFGMYNNWSKSHSRRQPQGDGIANSWQLHEMQHDLNLIAMLSNLEKVTSKVEAREFDIPSSQEALRKQQGQILWLGLAGNIFASFFLVVFFTRDINSRLMILADNANRLSMGKELNMPFGGADEISKLDSAFHETARTLSQARKKERAIFDNSNDVIAVIDNTGKFLSINAACWNNWSYTEDDLLGKRNLLEILHSDDLEQTGDKLFGQKSDLSDFSNLSLENRVMTGDGKEVFTLWSISRRQNDAMLFCIAHDITARKELELLKKEFLSIVSHDLRTPISSMLMITEMIAAEAFGPVSADALELVKQIQEDCHNLTELISDLLDLDKLEDGKMDFMVEKTDLQDVLKTAAGKVLGAASLELQPESAGNGLFVLADKERLIQALGNILSFAKQSSDSEISVSARQNGETVQITINDNAAALNLENRYSLFQLHGVGLEHDGIPARIRLTLVLARILIELQNGRISVSSDGSVVGNVYVVELPGLCNASVY